MIRFELNQRNNKLQLRAVLKKLEKIICKEFKKSGIISVAFVSSAEIKKLNRKYRKKDKSADILTFVLDDDDILGEIILSKKEVAARAKIRKEKTADTAIFLIIHGVLHIMGYAHKTDKEAEKMEEMELKIENLLKIEN